MRNGRSVLKKAFVMAICLSLLVTGVMFSNPVMVAAQTKTTFDLAKKLSAAKSGSTIIVPSGTYNLNDNIIIKSKGKLTIQGNGKVTIIGTNIEKPVFQFEKMESVTLKGLNFQHAITKEKQKGNCLLNFIGTKKVSIVSCDIGLSETGIEMRDGDTLALENIRIHDCTKVAIGLSNVNILTLKGVKIDKNRAYLSSDPKPKSIKDLGKNNIQADVDEIIEKGLTYEKAGQTDKALEQYALAIKLNPNNARAYLMRSYLYEKLKRYEEELKDLEAADKIEPNSWAASSLGVYFKDVKKDHEKAITYFNSALITLKDNPDAAWIYESLGDMYYEIANDCRFSDSTKAIDYLTKALVDYKGYPESMAMVYNSLSSIYTFSDRTKAVEYVFKAIELDKVYYFDALIWNEIESKELLEKAVTELNEVIEKGLPADMDNGNKARYYTARGMAIYSLTMLNKEAEDKTTEMTKALKDFTTSETLADDIMQNQWYTARVYAQTGKLQEAVDIYTKLLDGGDIPGMWRENMQKEKDQLTDEITKGE